MRSWARSLAVAVVFSVLCTDVSALSCVISCHETTRPSAVTNGIAVCHEAAAGDEAIVHLAPAPPGCGDNRGSLDAGLPVRTTDRLSEQSPGLPVALPAAIAASGPAILISSASSSPPRLARPAVAPLRL